MADDQSPKIMDINDLVRELSKSSTNPGTPPSAPKPFPLPPPSVSGSSPSLAIPSPVNSPLPKPLEMPKPQFNVPPPPLSKPNQFRPVSPSPAPLSGRDISVPATPLPSPGVKEYQSSIRTMNEDISRIKQGQKPTGIDVPRKVEQVVSIPQAIPPKPVSPFTSSGRGEPSQQFKVPSVNLGEAQKTGPLAQSKDFSRSGLLTPPPDLTKKSMPVKPIVEPKTQIYVPQEGQKGVNRNMLFMGIGALTIVAGFAYWFFVLRSPAPEVVVETPTPIVTPTPSLNYIFLGIGTENIIVKDPAIDLNSAIKTFILSGGEFKNLNITSESKGQTVLGLLDFLSNPTQQLVDNMDVEYRVLLYGQKEIFDSIGQLKIDSIVEKRLVFVNEIKDISLSLQLGTDWEKNMNEDLKSILEFDSNKQEGIYFGDNTYRGVSIRYKNFKYADRSIDYAVIPASNGKSYFVIAGSREAMYAAIDKLKGF